MKSFKCILSIAALTGALTFSANATFIVNTDFKGEVKMFNDVANKDVSMFKGFVGGNHSSFPNIDITTTGNVNTGSGFSTIKPIKDGSLTQLIFTPENDLLFSDFSFRGQLVAQGDVTLIVQDAAGDPSQTFTFGPFKKDQDFARQGIISLDGETIKSITLESAGFKEVKQIEWSFASGRVPDGGSTAMLLGGALAALGSIGLVSRSLKR